MKRRRPTARILMETLYATEPQFARFFHPLFWLMGLTARWTGWELMTVYHLWRVVLSCCLFQLIFAIGWHLFQEFRSTLAAWTLAIFGGGLGWALPGNWVEQLSNRHRLISADVSIVDAYVYIGAYRKPLFVAGMLLMLTVVWSWWQWESTRRTRHALSALGGVFLLSLIHPYDVLTLTGIAGTRWFIGVFRSPNPKSSIRNPQLWIPLGGILLIGHCRDGSITGGRLDPIIGFALGGCQ